MATDPRTPDLLRRSTRTGKFEESEVLRLYYVEPERNKNTTIRFRRYSNGE